MNITILVIGDSHVGKTLTVNNLSTQIRLNQKLFCLDISQDIYTPYYFFTHKSYHFKIWELNSNLSNLYLYLPLYCLHTDIVILVYDVNNYNSFINVLDIYQKIKSNPFIIICANKSDLLQEHLNKAIVLYETQENNLLSIEPINISTLFEFNPTNFITEQSDLYAKNIVHRLDTNKHITHYLFFNSNITKNNKSLFEFIVLHSDTFISNNSIINLLQYYKNKNYSYWNKCNIL